MKTRGIRVLISEHKAFQEFSEEHLELISGCAKNVRFQAGTRIAAEGDPAETFYLIRRGAVSLELRLSAQRRRVIETLHSGEVLGWSWLNAPFQWTFDVRALEDVSMVAFDGHCLRKKCEEDPVMGYKFLKIFSRVIVDRLQATRLQVLDLYGSREHA